MAVDLQVIGQAPLKAQLPLDHILAAVDRQCRTRDEPRFFGDEKDDAARNFFRDMIPLPTKGEI